LHDEETESLGRFIEKKLILLTADLEDCDSVDYREVFTLDEKDFMFGQATPIIVRLKHARLDNTKQFELCF
jgi:hypothetical protein